MAPRAAWSRTLTGIGTTFKLLVLVLSLLSGAAPKSVAANADAGRDRPWMRASQPAEVRAAELLARMTLKEKLGMVQGDGVDDPQCVGETAPIHRLGVPGLCMGDGAGGVSNGLKRVTQFPAPIALAATWNVTLAQEYGRAQAQEQFKKGRNVILAPTINIVRCQRWGRAAETYGEDPVLTSALAVAVVQGLQSEPVIAMAKHLAAYNQETDRFGEWPKFDAVNVKVSERALREIYFPAFRAVVEQAHVGAIMCAYMKINGQYACQSPQLLDPLRDDWHFSGFVTSDWFFAARGADRAAKAGMDQSMPGGRSPFGLPDYYGERLAREIREGEVPISRIDTMVKRILTTMFARGLFDHRNGGDAAVDVRTRAHLRIAEAVASESIVLLKNRGGELPLPRAPGSIAVIGADAYANPQTTEPYGGFVGSDSGVTPLSPLAGITSYASNGTKITYVDGTVGLRPLPEPPAKYFAVGSRRRAGWVAEYYNNTDLGGVPALLRSVPAVDGRRPAHVHLPHGWSARWKSTFTPPATGVYWFSLSGGGSAYLRIAGEKVVSLVKEQFQGMRFGSIVLRKGIGVSVEIAFNTAPGISQPALTLGWAPPGSDRIGKAVKAARHAKVAIVFAGDSISEGSDRRTLQLPGNQNALIAAVAAANPRTIVVLNTGAAVSMPWVKRVAAVLEAWYPGERDGDAIAGVLFGATDPSGKLPETFPAGRNCSPCTKRSEFPGVAGVVEYDEGLLVGYRWYNAKHFIPLFPFGFGLSYTRFALGSLHVRRAGNGDRMIQATIHNTGDYDGAEVVQVYVSFPPRSGEPPRQLKGFRRVDLAPGKAARVRFTVSPRMLRIWSNKSGRWIVPGGRYTAYVGTSSRDLPLRAAFHISARRYAR